MQSVAYDHTATVRVRAHTRASRLPQTVKIPRHLSNKLE